MSRAKNRQTSQSASSGGLLSATAKSVLVTAGVAAIANIGRKMATQAPTALASDWCEGLVREHEATLAALDKLAATPADHPQRRTVQLTALKHMISKHAIEEENVIYPMLRRSDDSGSVAELHMEHGEVKAMLFELSQMDKADAGFTTLLQSLRDALEDHMREEEEVLFPALRARLSEAENRKLTRTMNMAGVMVA